MLNSSILCIMKLSLITLLFLISISSSTNQIFPKQDNDELIIGTWELQGFYHYDGNEITDTVPTTAIPTSGPDAVSLYATTILSFVESYAEATYLT